MRKQNTTSYVVCVLCLFLLSACGVSKEQVAATMAVQTIEARGADTAEIEESPTDTDMPEASPSVDLPTETLTPEPSSLSSAGMIAFISDRNGNRDIYLINVDGTGERQLTFSDASDVFGSWSPDGSQMYHSDSRGPWVNRWDFDVQTGEI